LAVLRNKNCFEGTQIDDISDMQRHVVKELKTIPGDQFQECFEQWKHRLSVLTHKGVPLKVTVAASLQVIKNKFCGRSGNQIVAIVCVDCFLNTLTFTLSASDKRILVFGPQRRSIRPSWYCMLKYIAWLTRTLCPYYLI
jgi:hypothetical protein